MRQRRMLSCEVYIPRQTAAAPGNAAGGGESEMSKGVHEGTPEEDVLSEATARLRLRSHGVGSPSLVAPWRLRVEGGRGWYHAVTKGTCLLSVEDAADLLPLREGDLAVLPRGHRHDLCDADNGRAARCATPLTAQRLSAGMAVDDGASGTTALTSGCFMFDDVARCRLSAALPPVMLVPEEVGHASSSAGQILRAIVQESASHQPGAQTIVDHLVSSLLVQAIRFHMSTLPDDGGGWLRAWRDPDLGPALELIHRNLEVPWAVSQLAEKVAMSRSSFCARFSDTVGKPPGQYLTECRIEEACRLLREGGGGLKEVAARVGYESVAAFSKAFKRRTGRTPSAYRRCHTRRSSDPISPAPEEKIADAAPPRPLPG